jgi:ABC-type transport system involved in multi-copper enzyme maturation permease subunit
MTRLLRNFGLPLLGKELIEQAARKRTYVVRVVYASILFFVAFIACYETLRAGGSSPLAVLGRGRDMFMWLVYLQFAGVYLFMPAITCGVVTQEKEHDSLQLLFLTRLGPWTILFEKLLGRMVPMLSFLLLSLPLLAFAYSLGGVSPSLLWTGVWMLVLAMIQMGTLALMCSSFFRTTVGAFVSTYVIAFILFFGPYMMMMLLVLVGYLLDIDFEHLLRGFSSWFTPDMVFLALFPFFAPPYFLALTVMPGGLGTWVLCGHSIFVLLVSGGCLLAARKCLVARAFIPPRNYLLEFLKLFDRRQPVRRAAGTASSTVVETDPARLPGDAPIAWRETTRRSLGRPRYLLRVLLFTEVPLLLFCWLLVVTNLSTNDYSFIPRTLVSLAVFLLWVLAVLVVAVQSASLIAGERSHQTLEVLCTTPLSGRDIVLQKFAGVRRLILVLMVPFLTLFVCELLVRVISAWRGRWGETNFHALAYMVASILTLVIYLPLVAWMSLAIGLKVRTQARALIGSLAAIVGWAVVPYLFCFMPLAIASSAPGRDETFLYFVSLLSPVTVIFWNEIESDFLNQTFHEGVWIPYLVNFLGYGAALVSFRAMALRNADRWLGRSDYHEEAPTENSGPMKALRTWLGRMEAGPADTTDGPTAGWRTNDVSVERQHQERGSADDADGRGRASSPVS